MTPRRFPAPPRGDIAESCDPRDGTRAAAHEILGSHWNEAGFTVPHAGRYPHLWLWDSCFHAIVWSALGEPERAIAELRTALGAQAEDGFVPHITYVGSNEDASFWGRPSTSSVTQPPMYGHAIAELLRSGVAVPPDLVVRATTGLDFLLRRRQRIDGLVAVVHPWETGADDSPRWDHWWGESATPAAKWTVKGAMVRTITRSFDGSPLANRGFVAAPASFNALVAFNAFELADVTGDDALAARALQLAEVLDERWDPELGTWVDAGDAARGSGRIRTADALFPLLVTVRPDVDARVAAALSDPTGFYGSCGIAGVHRTESTFDPRAYWRGSAWPQVWYVLWIAARRLGLDALAELVRGATVRGAVRSGFAEHWDPDDASPLGARPQSWSTLAAVMR